MKTKAKYIIRGEFLPLQFRTLGAILVLMSYLNLESQYVDYSILFLLTGFLLLFSRFGVVIKTDKKIVKPYFSVFFIRIGRTKKYDLLTCFWLTSHRMKNVWQNAAVKSESKAYGVVNVYLITSEGDNLYLFKEPSRQAVYERLAIFMKELGIKCLDKRPDYA